MASKDGTNVHANRPQRSTKRPHSSSIPYVNLEDGDNDELLREPSPQQVQSSRKKKPKPPVTSSDLGTGCLVCGLDNDHKNLLICETCGGEFHTYCLSPPLNDVPENNWYCDKCNQGDDLENLMTALPESYTSRFGQIVWAQGGVGYGWWPACIYDPRLTLGTARMQAIKYLGKKHLVYFFECLQAPFELLPESKIMEWEQGIMEDCHLGKSVKSSRLKDFHCAVHAASIEENKPRDRRLDWNHQGAAAAQAAQHPEENTTQPMVGEPAGGKPKTLDDLSTSENNNSARSKKKRGSKKDDGELYCTVFLGDKERAPVGFVRTHSRLKSNFTHIRRVIENDLVPDAIKVDWDWRFLVPSLGPVSKKQEAKFGPALPFLQQASDNGGDGTLKNPVQVVLVEAPKPVV